MHVKILYCRPCRYLERAEELAAALREGFPDTIETIEIEEGMFGQFDVFLDGELVASKGGFWARKLKHGAPATPKVLDAIRNALADREGDACDIDPEPR